MSLTYGELCAGYGGLGMGVQSILGGEMAWCVEFDAAPSKILAHHWPDAPNFGDLTAVDWTTVPWVDVLTAGFPCQPFSHAGKRLGANDPRHLWPHIAKAIGILRPRLVVLENVRGLLSGQGEPDTEEVTALDRRDKQLAAAIARAKQNRSPRVRSLTLRLIERRRRVVDALRRARARLVRAIGAVLRDLANLGYDVRWYGLRAADVGAAHGRFRVFLFATPADAGSGGGFQAVERDGRGTQGVHGAGVPDESDRDALRAGPVGVPGQLTLLPTPAVNDMGASYTPETWDEWTAKMQAAHGNGNGHGKSLNIEALRLLPTPTTVEGTGPGTHGTGGDNLRTVVDALLPTPSAALGGGGQTSRSGDRKDERLLAGIAEDATAQQDWREYEAAIRRQEAAFGRPAPLPTEPGAKGQPRLSPKFVEWLMGLPAGHVTDVPGISRNDQLKALGNGVVPQQAAAATRAFIADMAKAVVA